MCPAHQTGGRFQVVARRRQRRRRFAHPGAQAYYDSQIAQFADWGVDFIKADDMLFPYHEREIAAYTRAIQRSGRPIELSLSPGTDVSLARLDHLREHATMWRVCDDLWDRWEDVEAQFARMARWAPWQSERGWADADMLPLGHIGIRAERGEDRPCSLTRAEQISPTRSAAALCTSLRTISAGCFY
jgi:alpha-galactosidase